MLIQKIPSSACSCFSWVLNSSVHTSELSDHRPMINMRDTFPLVATPRVTQLENPLFFLALLCRDIHLLAIEDRVGVGRNQTQVAISVIILGRAYENMVHRCVGRDEVPRRIYIHFILGVLADVLEWCASESIQTYSSKPRLNNFVWPKNFSISFLHKHDPQLIPIVPRKNRRVIMHRDPIINDHTLPEPINKEPNTISTIRWLFSSFEDSLDDEWVLTDASQGW